ncbi:hypothetical protein HPB51_000108 [Rhipicephalus microplus]|uniref:Tick transposon n=1 Tax=Rhipicephalus microplus TaxID=6941 RepID=A0A9J6D3H6_RHIMP|nr:hypothetical protein HPB51_000108 [Rhipicephalus microplus]
MEYIVEGQDVSPEELSDESWQSPGLRAQEQRRAALRLATAAAKPTTTPASLPSSKRVNTSPPQHRRRAPLPRLPADTIHIVGRPKSPVELTKLQPWHLYTALLQAAFLQDLPPASRDTVRIHPVNNTFTLSVADSARAQAYLRITSLTVSGNTFTVHLYAPPPDDALRGILYHAFDDFTDQAILEDLQASNPTLSVVGGRRMGKAPHILVTLMEPKLPRWIFYHGVQLRLLPFRNKVEACYNCRSTGHRTDVCPKPRQERCHRCGAAHPTPPEGSPPTCNPRCIVCNGNHSTYSSNCKHRYVQRPQRQKAPAPDTHPPPQQPVPPAAVGRSSQQAASGPSPAPPPKSVTASPPPVPAVPKPTSQPMNSTWPRGAPGLPSEPQVVALQQENASLRQQVTAQSAQIAAQKTQIDSLQAKLQALEEKLESAITVKSSLPSTICSSSDMDVQTPEGCTGKRRRPNTPLESLHFSEEVQTSPPTPPPRPSNLYSQQLIAYKLPCLEASEQSYPSMPAPPPPPAPPEPRKHRSRQHLPLLKMADRSIVTIWQWNCRGFRPKRNHLLLHLQQLDPSDAPDIIVLQETHADVSLSGYVAYNQVTHHPLPHPVTAVLTRRTLAVNRHDLPFPAVHHVFLETLPQQREQPSLFILNVYNPPRSTEDASLLALLRAAAAKAAKSPLLILGDFNVKHPDWGYSKADGPGRRLWQLAHDLNLSLLTDPTQPTRIGNSVCRDTTPDLSFCRSVPDARWYNTHQSLGSDHYVLTIQVLTSPSKPRPHTARYTDWDAFRERRLHSATSNIEDLSTWTDQLLEDLDAVTASIPTTKDYPATDARLAHLWAARTGLCNRWQKQRHNRRLRRRIAHLDRTIEQHTTALARQQWEQLCSGLSGQLGCKQSWHLLRHLLDPASAKLVARQQLQRVVRAYPGDTPSLMADLSAKYLQLLPPGTPPPPLASYSGAPNPTLQRATDVVTSHVHAAGLTCSAAKSALLLMRPPDRRRYKTPHPTITVHANSTPVPVVSHLRVLGLILQSNRHNTHTIDKLSLSVQQTARMLARVRARREGMREHDLLRLVDAFVVSRLTYGLPYTRLLKSERDKIDVLIRRSYKTALGLPPNTSTDRLLRLGVHNTLDELIEAHRSAQVQRLYRSPTGRHILSSIGHDTSSHPPDLVSLPHAIRAAFYIKPLPKNMLAGHHDARRQARAAMLHAKYADHPAVAYVDAARYNARRDAFVVVSVSPSSAPLGPTITAGTVRTPYAVEAEEVAIALAATSADASVIISDSKQAISNFARGLVSPTTLRLLRPLLQQDEQCRIELIWVPAHSGHPGNETAHQRARGFVDRAVGHSESDALVPEPLVTYHDITQHYRLERYFYSHPHSSLPKRSEIAWRRLQTRTFPCPLVFSYMHPGAIDPRCCLCGNVASLNHILWGCPEDPPPADLLCSPPTEGQWEALLSSNDIDIQTRVLKRAEEVIEKHSLAAFVA